jgi:hypothetical protein
LPVSKTGQKWAVDNLNVMEACFCKLPVGY